jgi:hypothetical protein
MQMKGICVSTFYSFERLAADSFLHGFPFIVFVVCVPVQPYTIRDIEVFAYLHWSLYCLCSSSSDVHTGSLIHSGIFTLFKRIVSVMTTALFWYDKKCVVSWAEAS